MLGIMNECSQAGCMGLRSMLIALWYGLKWGFMSPYHAYRAGKDYGTIIGLILGLSVFVVWPVSIVLGTLYATGKYYRSGGQRANNSKIQEFVYF